MAKIVEACYEATGHTSFICDFSPPRSGDPEALRQAALDANFISVAYNPGKAVRANSAMLAAAIKRHLGQEVVFTLATRDMNRLALESLLLGAQLLGLDNVIVVQGDPFSERDLARLKDVGDFRPTELIAAVQRLNQGQDFRESNLRTPTDFCVGATVDLGRGVEDEARLAARKIDAGAQFLITQPIFDPAEASQFLEAYSRFAEQDLPAPVYYGLQVMEADGVIFSSVPQLFRDQLASGRSGVDLATELFQEVQRAGLHNVYIVPPIRRGGARNYDAAQEVLKLVERI